MSAIKHVVPKWPVVEVFGPTVQGEGVDQGVVSHFIRFGGCDYRCDWCDTPYAVLPDQVRENAERYEVADILGDLSERPFAPWIILTGGNPCLHDLAPLVDALHADGYLVAVETQGSRWREWLRNVDRLCVSPKPPSAKEPKSQNDAVHKFLLEGMNARDSGKRPYEWMFLKIVIFNEEDLDYAELMRSQFGDAYLYLSAGNDAGATVGNPDRKDDRGLSEVRNDLLNRAVWLTEQVFQRPNLMSEDVFVQAQFHTALWGNGQGF